MKLETHVKASFCWASWFSSFDFSDFGAANFISSGMRSLRNCSIPGMQSSRLLSSSSAPGVPVQGVFAIECVGVLKPSVGGVAKESCFFLRCFGVSMDDTDSAASPVSWEERTMVFRKCSKEWIHSCFGSINCMFSPWTGCGNTATLPKTT